MKQLTQQEAISLGESCVWQGWTHQQRAAFQLSQDKLCMPFSVFHESVSIALGRPVYTHEFGLNRAGLQAELAGMKSAPTMEEIIGLIPTEKVIVMVVDAGGAA